MDNLLDFAIEQWSLTPDLQVQDAYKWLLHAACGADHAITSDEGPRRWLEREWETLDAPLDEEPRLVELVQGGGLVRLNLRPYKQVGGEPEALLQAFVRSAQSVIPDKELLRNCWQNLGNRLRAGELFDLQHEAWIALNEKVQQLDFPAIHHSPKYESKYRPAYRVLTNLEAKSLISPLLG